MELKFKKPDYSDCTAGIPNSIAEFYGIEKKGRISPLTSSILKDTDADNIVVFILDAMGRNTLEGDLEEDGFLRSHVRGYISSVFLSSTVPSTVSLMTGLLPKDHLWLGWDTYFPEIDENVSVFTNTVKDTSEPAAKFSVARTFTPYEDLIGRLNKSGMEAYYSMPFEPPFPQDLDSVCERIRDLTKKPGRKYIYAYWSEPDGTFHKKGCFGPDAKKIMKDLEDKMEEFSGELKNTLLLITADHGHIDITGTCIRRYPEIMKCLVRLPSLEARAMSFYVKEGMEDVFEKEFKKEFGDTFVLLKTEEAIRQGFYGEGEVSERFKEKLGQYLAYATTELTLFTKEEDVSIYKGYHGGLTEDEMTIPLIAVECRD